MAAPLRPLFHQPGVFGRLTRRYEDVNSSVPYEWHDGAEHLVRHLGQLMRDECESSDCLQLLPPFGPGLFRPHGHELVDLFLQNSKRRTRLPPA
jgi:hypothetical protein